MSDFRSRPVPFGNTRRRDALPAWLVFLLGFGTASILAGALFVWRAAYLSAREAEQAQSAKQRAVEAKQVSERRAKAVPLPTMKAMVQTPPLQTAPAPVPEPPQPKENAATPDDHKASAAPPGRPDAFYLLTDDERAFYRKTEDKIIRRGFTLYDLMLQERAILQRGGGDALLLECARKSGQADPACQEFRRLAKITDEAQYATFAMLPQNERALAVDALRKVAAGKPIESVERDAIVAAGGTEFLIQQGRKVDAAKAQADSSK